MFHRGQELPFGYRRGRCRFVLGIQQAFQHHVARQQFVEAEVDPAQSAECDGAFHFVLAGDHVLRFERRDEVVFHAALAAKTGLALQGRIAPGAESFALRHLRIEHDGAFRVS